MSSTNENTLAARCDAAAGGLGCVFPALTCKALSLFVREKQIDVSGSRFGLRDRVLSNDAAVVFHLDLQSIVRQDAVAELQDFSKASRHQFVVGVVSDPRLQEARLAFAERAAAIDKVLSDVSDFCDMEMRRYFVSVRENEANPLFGIGCEDRF